MVDASKLGRARIAPVTKDGVVVTKQDLERAPELDVSGGGSSRVGKFVFVYAQGEDFAD